MMKLQLYHNTNTESLLRLHRKTGLSAVILESGLNETFNKNYDQ